MHLVTWICFTFTASTTVLLALKSQKLKHGSFQDQANCQNARIFTWPSRTCLDDEKATGKHGKVTSTNSVNLIALLKRNDPTVEKFGAGLRPPSRLSDWQNATCNSVNPTSIQHHHIAVNYFTDYFNISQSYFTIVQSMRVPSPKMSWRQLHSMQCFWRDSVEQSTLFSVLQRPNVCVQDLGIPGSERRVLHLQSKAPPSRVASEFPLRTYVKSMCPFFNLYLCGRHVLPYYPLLV